MRFIQQATCSIRIDKAIRDISRMDLVDVVNEILEEY